MTLTVLGNRFNVGHLVITQGAHELLKRAPQKNQCVKSTQLKLDGGRAAIDPFPSPRQMGNEHLITRFHCGREHRVRQIKDIHRACGQDGSKMLQGPRYIARCGVVAITKACCENQDHYYRDA